MKYYLLKPGFTEETVIYEVKLKKVASLKQMTVNALENKLNELGVTRLIIDAGYPHIIERLRRKWLVYKLLRRKLP